MKITVEFDTEEEFKARIKNPRGGKGGDKDDDGPAPGATQAPAPLMPPHNPNPQFQPPQGQLIGGAPAPTAFAPPQGGFPGAPVGDPVVAGLVQRIVARIDGAIASGQPADAVLNWFRGQCGAEAGAATMDQIKAVFLPKLAVPGLENIAKLMNA
jgi:hypothetical protein